jgi:hypothetical protein
MKEELLKSLKSFDLPAHRKAKTNKSNLLWLSRNIKVRNSDHPNLERVLELINEGISQGGYQ